MPRPGITYDQVSAVCEELIAAKTRPSIKAIRSRLRTGSPNTIHKMLQAWAATRPIPSTPLRELPAGIIRGIQEEIARSTSEARTELEERLAQAQEEANELAAEGEVLEAEREALQTQIASLTSERDTLQGRTNEQTDELARALQNFSQERELTERLRIEIAQERLTGVDARRRLEQQDTELEKLRNELQQEREGRINAERTLAAKSATHEALIERANELQIREHAATKELAELRERDYTLEKELTEFKLKAASDAQASALECTRLVHQLELLQHRPTPRKRPPKAKR